MKSHASDYSCQSVTKRFTGRTGNITCSEFSNTIISQKKTQDETAPHTSQVPVVSQFKATKGTNHLSKLIPQINNQTFRIRKSMYRNDLKKPEVLLSENKDLIKKNDKLPFRGMLINPKESKAISFNDGPRESLKVLIDTRSEFIREHNEIKLPHKKVKIKNVQPRQTIKPCLLEETE